MAAIHIPDRRFRQPADIVGVHPDWEGRVVSLIHFGAGAPVDLAAPQMNYSIVGAVNIEPVGPGLVGLRAGGGGTTTGYIEATNALPAWSGQPTLIFFLSQIAPVLDVQGAMLHAITSQSKYTQITANGSSLYVLGSGSAASLGEDLRGTRNRSLIARTVNGSEAVFIDNRKVTGVASTVSAGAKTIRLGYWTSPGWQFNGVYGSVAVIAGAITDDEAYQLVENPWGLYEAEQSIIYSFPTGGIVTLNSLTASNITSSGARFTVGLTR